MVAPYQETWIFDGHYSEQTLIEIRAIGSKHFLEKINAQYYQVVVPNYSVIELRNDNSNKNLQHSTTEIYFVRYG